MKNYEDFKNFMVEQVQKLVSYERRVEVHRVMKNNQLTLDSMVILSEGCSISPQFYLEHYYSRYQRGEKIEYLVREIIETYERTLTERDWSSQLDLSLEHCGEQIIYRLVSYEKNKELLEGTPYIPFLNLVITFHCLMMQDEHGIGSIRVSDALMEEWGLDHKSLFALAQENTMRKFPIRLRTLEQMLTELLESRGESPENIQKIIGEMNYESEIEPYVLTNEMGINGAAVVVYPGCLEMVGDSINNDFYLLPGSIHEMLVIPADTTLSVEEMRNMVVNVNRKCVEQDELLSDDVYFYSRSKGVMEVL
ncbi:MAG: hypothetical protein J1E62_00305 [Lachnospiraceae bacterium]|nr:hypothetical protein [Lachnospiraceae bacterium]